MLELQLLGFPRVLVAGQVVKVPTRKGLLLLARLGLGGRTSRAELSELLWPDLTAAAARQNLRVELYRLTHTPLKAYLHLARSDLELCGAWQVDALDPAADLSGGELLEDEALLDGPLGEWLEEVRAERRSAVQARLTTRVRQAEAAGDLSQACEVARAIVRLDPLDAASQSEWLRLLVQSGETRLARTAYAAYADLLRREVGAEPEAQVRRWLEAASEQPRTEALQAPLIGRERLWKELRLSSVPVLLLGEPGAGKSRLVEEFSAQQRPRLLVRGLAEARWWPLGAVTSALRSLETRGRLPDLAPADRELLSRFLPGLTPQDAGPLLDADPLGGGNPERRRALFETLSRVLLAALDGGSLILEDLHDYDNLSIEAAQHLLADVARLPLQRRPKVVITARAPELAQHPAAQQFIRQLESGGDLRRLRVEGLQETEVLSLIRTLGRTSGGARFAARLHAATAGNPLFLLETLRHLRERGDLEEDAAGHWHTRFDDTTETYAELDLPRSVTGAVQARVLALGETPRRVLEALATLARPASLETLEALTQLEAWPLAEAIGAAREAHLIAAQAGSYSLAHDLYRVSIRLGLTAERRQVLHRQAAQMLAAQAAPAREVAQHWLAADHPRQAGEWLLKAAEQANTRFARSEALGFLDEALALDLPPALRARAHALATQITQQTGDLTSAQRHLDALRRLADQLQDTDLSFEADLRLAVQKYNQSEYQAVVDLTEPLLSLNAPETLKTQLHLYRGFSLSKLGRFAETELHLAAALRSGTLQRTRWAFLVHSSLAQTFLPQGRLQEAEHHAREAVDAARALGDPLMSAQGLMIHSAAAFTGGQVTRAIELLREAEALTRQLNPSDAGHARVAAMIPLNLGSALWAARRYQEARQSLEKGLADPQLPPELRETAYWNLGAIKFSLGDLGGALSDCQEALEKAGQRGMLATVARRRACIAELLLQMGHLGAAQELPEIRAATEQLGLGELRHLLANLELRAAMLSASEGELQVAASALMKIEPSEDELERHFLLLAETHLSLGQLCEALAFTKQAPPGAWRARLELLCWVAQDKLARESTEQNRLPELEEQAGQWLSAPETSALEAALLACTLARTTRSPAHLEYAKRRAGTLEASLAGRPERQSLEQLLRRALG